MFKKRYSLKALQACLLVFFSFVSGYSLAESLIYRIDQYDVISKPALEVQLKEIYVKAFSEVYKDHWSIEFEQETLDIFTTYIEKFKKSKNMVLVATIVNNTIVGWSLFDKSDSSAILELICIDPAYWRQGLGKKLVFAIRDFYSCINHISMVTRKVNALSPFFYQSIGFKKTSFSLPEYSATEMQGFEWTLAELDEYQRC